MNLSLPIALLERQQASAMPSPHMLAFGLALLLAAVAWLIFAIVRRVFKNSREARNESADASPRVENSAAFMTASMQGVIRKLREQEKNSNDCIASRKSAPNRTSASAKKSPAICPRA